MFFTPYGSSLPCFLPHRMLHSMPSHCCITWIMHPYSKSPLPRVNLTRPECRDDRRSRIRAGGKSHCNIVQRSLLHCHLTHCPVITPHAYVLFCFSSFPVPSPTFHILHTRLSVTGVYRNHVQCSYMQFFFFPSNEREILTAPMYIHTVDM